MQLNALQKHGPFHRNETIKATPKCTTLQYIKYRKVDFSCWFVDSALLSQHHTAADSVQDTITWINIFTWTFRRLSILWTIEFSQHAELQRCRKKRKRGWFIAWNGKYECQTRLYILFQHSNFLHVQFHSRSHIFYDMKSTCRHDEKLAERAAQRPTRTVT